MYGRIEPDAVGATKRRRVVPLRSVALALLVAALVALVWLAVSNTGLADPRPLRRHYLFILLYAYVVLALPPVVGGERRDTAIALAGGALLALLLTVDLTTLRFFGEPFVRIYPFLPVQAGTVTPDGALGYAASYIPLTVALLASGTVAAGLVLASRVRARNAARWTVLALLPIAFVAARLASASGIGGDPRIAALMDAPPETVETIGAAPAARALALDPAPSAMPDTIVLVVMESTGATVPSADGKGLLSDAIIERSGTRGWVRFEQAVTNSNATDVSIPSILTGAGAHEPREKLMRMPVVSQYAQARGYDTALITSAWLGFGGLGDFLKSGGLRQTIAAEQSNLPFISDLAVDDAFMYRAAVREILDADGRLFLILYPHGLHWPFQNESALPIPANATSRRARAAGIAEAGFGLLFDALRESGRLDDALVVVTGDHGEFDYGDTLRVPRMRLETFGEGVLSPIFFVKPPGGERGAGHAALAANRDRLVANTDIAPTIAGVLGARPAKDGFAGQSLFSPIADDRVIFSSATNPWRAWPKSALAVSRGRERMLCDQRVLCRLERAEGPALHFERAAGPDDPLFAAALENRTMRRAMGAIYRGYYD